MKRRSRIYAAIIAVVVISVSAVIYVRPWESKLDPSGVTVRLNAPFPAIDFAPFWIAKQKGWIEESLAAVGASPDYQKPFLSIPLTNESLDNNTVDVVLTSGTPPIIAQSSGVDAKIIWLLATLNSELLIHGDSNATNISDLVGKKIGTPSGSGSHYWFMKHLANAGHSSDEVEIKDLGPPDAVDAFKAGEVDVLAVFPPFSEFALIEGAKALPGVKSPIQVVVVARGQFVSENPEITDALLEALNRAKTWLIENPEEAQQIVAKETNLPLEIVSLAWPKIAWEATLNDEIAEDLQGKAEFLLNLKKINTPVDVRKDLIINGLPRGSVNSTPSSIEPTTSQNPSSKEAIKPAAQ